MWLKDLKSNSSPDIKIFLIGNKTDLEDNRVITKEMAEKFKNDYEIDFFMETSAKTGFNTQELFVKAAKVLYDDFNEYKKSKINEEDIEEQGIKIVDKEMNMANSRCC